MRPATSALLGKATNRRTWLAQQADEQVARVRRARVVTKPAPGPGAGPAHYGARAWSRAASATRSGDSAARSASRGDGDCRRRTCGVFAELLKPSARGHLPAIPTDRPRGSGNFAMAPSIAARRSGSVAMSFDVRRCAAEDLGD